MIEILTAIAVFAFVVLVVFRIFYLIDLRRTSRTLRSFLEGSGEKLDQSLDDLKIAIKSARGTLEDAAAVSAGIRSVAENAAKMSELWAGIKMVIDVLFRPAHDRGGRTEHQKKE